MILPDEYRHIVCLFVSQGISIVNKHCPDTYDRCFLDGHVFVVCFYLWKEPQLANRHSVGDLQFCIEKCLNFWYNMLDSSKVKYKYLHDFFQPIQVVLDFI